MRLRLVALASIGIVLVTGGLVWLVFALGPGDRPEVAPGAITSPTPTDLTPAQFRREMTRICSDANEKARLVEETAPAETVLGLEVKIEQDEVRAIERLRAPTQIRSQHGQLLALWERRVALMDSTYRRLDSLTVEQADTAFAEVDSLALQIAPLFKALGVPDCSFTNP